MDEIVLISGTNREDSITRVITDIYAGIFAGMGVKTKIIDLRFLPHTFAFSALYDNAGLDEDFNKFRQMMLDAKKYVFVVPEYNGGFPGVLKTFIDGLKFPQTFTNKKCALVGLSAGVQGAGLALSHLTDIFNYCGMHVLALKPKLARIEEHLEKNDITNTLYNALLEKQARQLLEF